VSVGTRSSPFRSVSNSIFSLLPQSGSVGLGPESFSIGVITFLALLVNGAMELSYDSLWHGLLPQRSQI